MINLINIDNKKSLELKKHVGAIHSSNRLTLIQRKVANALLYNSYDNLLTQDRHSIHIKILCDLIGYNSKDYKTVKNSLVALISTVIQWNLIDKNKDEKDGIWNASSIIADASIDGPICSYSYSQNMKQLLYHPEVYGRLNMNVQAKFKSTYGLALYENCARYQGITHTQWFDLTTFRLLMGVEKGEYLIFRDFKRRIIDKAVNEVNCYSSMLLKVRFKKQGRAVIALQFLIEHKQKISSNDSDILKLEPHKSLSNTLQSNFGFSSIQAEKMVKNYGEDYILNKINIVEDSESFKVGKIVNLAKYLEHAIEKDYQPPKSSMERISSIKQQKMQSNKIQENEKIKREEYRRFQDEEILKTYGNLCGDEKLLIEKAFAESIKNNVYYDAYIKGGIRHVLVADKFCFFVRNSKQKFLGNIISFEGFCALVKKPT